MVSRAVLSRTSGAASRGLGVHGEENRSSHQPSPPGPFARSLRALLRLCGFALLGVLATVVFVVLSYELAPSRNTDLQHFDTLLVLGSPAANDGSIGIEQKWRMNEAIREFRSGRADHMILSGGAVYNHFVEAHVMSGYALQAGVPDHAIIQETSSRNTAENVSDSAAIMDAHGWRSVEVISSPEHLERAGLLLQRTHLLWRAQAAPTPGRGQYDIRRHVVAEALATAALRAFGPRIDPLLHRLKIRFRI